MHRRLYAVIAVMTLFAAVPAAASPEAAPASSCAIEMSPPVLRSIHSEVDPVAVGDELFIVATAQNCNEAAQSFVAIIEVRNSLMFTESLALQPVTLQGNDEVEIAVSWVPAYGDDYQLRAFAATDADLPRALSPVTASSVQIVERNTENLVLEFNVTNTDVSTAEQYGTSYYLVNKGRRTVWLTVDDYIGAYVSANGATPVREGPDVSCVWKYASRIEQPDAALRPGEMMNLTEMSSTSEAPKYPGTYNISPFVILSVQVKDRVKCLEVVGNAVTLNVTGPAPEGVSLVLETDKESYTVEEDVRMSLYIENTSDEPFVLSQEAPSVTITRSDDGAKILETSWIADNLGPITVGPHSTYRLDNSFPLVWDLEDVYQIPPQDDEDDEMAAPGTYLISASFAYPYLESETLEISVE